MFIQMLLHISLVLHLDGPTVMIVEISLAQHLWMPYLFSEALLSRLKELFHHNLETLRLLPTMLLEFLDSLAAA